MVFIVSLILTITNISFAKQKNITSIMFVNPLGIELKSKALRVKRITIDSNKSKKGFPLLIYNGSYFPSQINDLDGDGNWDELFLVIDFKKNQSKRFQIRWVNKAPKFPTRTSIRFGKRESVSLPIQSSTEETLLANQVPKTLGFQKYQTDGPTWENDKIGFRHYLDGRNAKDIFGKKIANITPENVGISDRGAVEDNYHVMSEWGRDIFPVGNSVGLGGYAMLVDNEIHRLGITSNDTLNNIEKTSFKIVYEGSENSVIDYKYQNWAILGNKYQVKETTSIWPGIYGFQNSIILDGLKGNEDLLIGLSNINNNKPLEVFESGNFICLALHDNLGYNREWIMGTAIIIPKKVYNGYIEAPKSGQLTNSYLAKVKVNNNEPISYYAIAAWELSIDRNFKDATYFKNYVKDLAVQLSTEITIITN